MFLSINKKIIIISALIAVIALSADPERVFASNIRLSEIKGDIKIGDTFDVSIILDTEGKSINAVSVDLSFPKERIQLISPSIGPSVVSVWINRPEFSNTSGLITFEGGIPQGINSSSAIVATLRFRAKAPGSAVVKFLDSSRVLLNDGLGTDDLVDMNNGVYQISLPAPAGPHVFSESHPDQSKWYQSRNVIFSWESPIVAGGYSYSLSKNPVDIPDDISEGVHQFITYKDLSDGNHYFHIKSLSFGIWGGATHYIINVDASAPAKFPVEIWPGWRTSSKQILVSFLSSDNLSGLDRYEIKTVPLFSNHIASAQDDEDLLFIEATSPYLLSNLTKGYYDIIVRAIDKAGNMSESKERVEITGSALSFISNNGLFIGTFRVSWPIFILLLILITAIALYFVKKPDRLTHLVDIFSSRNGAKLPEDTARKLEELKRYRSKYGKLTALILVVSASLFFFASSVFAETKLLPPQITTFSENISNQEIFYVGGFTARSNIEVVIYLQNLETGETYNLNSTANEQGEWFYRHDNFLPRGDYILWTQSVDGGEKSAPSSQYELVVEKTALQFGSTRVGIGMIYAGLSLILLVIIFILLVYIARHIKEDRKRRFVFGKEIGEVEEAVRYGFAMLKKDIEREIEVLSMKDGVLTKDEEDRKEMLLQVLELIRQKIGKEITDVRNLSR